MRDEQGTKLVEVLVGVATLVIVCAALTPMVLQLSDDERPVRAREGAEALGRAILAFHADTGHWPVSDDGDLADEGEVSRLVGLPRARLGGFPLPRGDGVTPGSDDWAGSGAGGAAAALEDFLILNRDADTDPLYPPPDPAPAARGWRGPYLDAVPLDPWGRPFLVNVRYLDGARVAGVAGVEAERRAVFVISAGANGRFETPFGGAPPADAAVGGDDVAWLLEARRTAR